MSETCVFLRDLSTRELDLLVIAYFIAHFRRLRHDPLRALLTAALCVLAGLAVYIGSWHLWAQYHYRAALRELELSFQRRPQKHLERAREHLAKCLEVWPTGPATQFQAARAARRAKAYDEAEEHLRLAGTLGVEPGDVAREWAMMHAQRTGNVEQSLMSAVSAGHPDSVAILDALVQGYLATFQFLDVLECVDRWLALQPDNPYVLSWRGFVQRRRGMRLDAMADYSRVLELDPEDDEARQALAELLIDAHRPQDALAEFTYLRERLPDSTLVALGLVSCHTEMGNSDEAHRILDELLAAKPDSIQALVVRGRLAIGSGDSAQAEKWLRRAYELGPYERETIYSLYSCLMQNGKTEEGKKMQALLERIEADLDRVKKVTGAIMQFPHDPALRCEAGRILLHNGQDVDGLRWLDSALQQDPQHGPTHEALAEYYQSKGNTELAARHRLLATAMDPAQVRRQTGVGP